MAKYRVQIIEFNNGDKTYYPQYKTRFAFFTYWKDFEEFDWIWQRYYTIWFDNEEQAEQYIIDHQNKLLDDYVKEHNNKIKSIKYKEL